MTRTTYQPKQDARSRARDATRERILTVAQEAFNGAWYDDVTLRDIATTAGVALQTVVNHFGSKEQLFLEAGDRTGDAIGSARWEVPAGDVSGGVRVLLETYERLGDAMLRNLAVEDKLPVVRPMIDRGRREHQRWVERTFPQAIEGLSGAARSRRIAQLVAVTDVYTWKLLRRDKRLSVQQVHTAVLELVLALHPSTHHSTHPSTHPSTHQGENP